MGNCLLLPQTWRSSERRRLAELDAKNETEQLQLRLQENILKEQQQCASMENELQVVLARKRAAAIAFHQFKQQNRHLSPSELAHHQSRACETIRNYDRQINSQTSSLSALTEKTVQKQLILTRIRDYVKNQYHTDDMKLVVKWVDRFNQQGLLSVDALKLDVGEAVNKLGDFNKEINDNIANDNTDIGLDEELNVDNPLDRAGTEKAMDYLNSMEGCDPEYVNQGQRDEGLNGVEVSLANSQEDQSERNLLVGMEISDEKEEDGKVQQKRRSRKHAQELYIDLS